LNSNAPKGNVFDELDSLGSQPAPKPTPAPKPNQAQKPANGFGNQVQKFLIFFLC
jgi:hypothetical protein